MSNLVPERRVNKNGVSVIKHVRPDTNGSNAAAARIPSPAVAPIAASVRERWEDILAVAQSTALADSSQLHRLDNLASLGEDTLSRLEDVIRSARTEVDREEITRLLRRHTTLHQVKARVNSLHVFRDLIGTDGNFDLNILSATVVGLFPEPIMLHAIDYSKPSLYSVARPKVELMAALYRSPIIRQFPNPYKRFTEIESGALSLHPALQTIVMRNPKRVRDIINLIIERKFTTSGDDMRHLREIIEGSSTSVLMDGVL